MVLQFFGMHFFQAAVWVQQLCMKCDGLLHGLGSHLVHPHPVCTLLILAIPDLHFLSVRVKNIYSAVFYYITTEEISPKNSSHLMAMQRFLTASVMYTGSVSVESDVKALSDLVRLR